MRTNHGFATVRYAAIALLGAMALTAAAQGQNAQQHWVGTWAAAPYAQRILPTETPAAVPPGSPAAGAAAGAAPAQAATGSPAPGSTATGAAAATVSPSPVPEEAPTFAATTFREIVHTSLGGPMLRVVLTNEMGTGPLTIGAAHVALPVAAASGTGNAGAIQPQSDHALTFNGAATVTIPAGAAMWSDPVAMQLPAFANLAVSVFVPEQPLSVMTFHAGARQTSFKGAGDQTSAATLTDAKPISSWYLLKDVEVAAKPQAAAVVAFGDSITDGAHATQDANARWPDVLAARLAGNKKTADLGVLNEGIGGNRVLHDGAGPNALARFDRDVLGQSGAKYLIILESINDIGRRARPDGTELVSAQELINGLNQMVMRAHAHGIKVFGATLTPYEGAGYSTDQGQQDRQAVNTWIRTGGVVDGVIDFDKATQDPAHPGMFLPKYDSGDHLHPSDEGYKAMGDAIDLALFK